jgi:hypothetical protein
MRNTAGVDDTCGLHTQAKYCRAYHGALHLAHCAPNLGALEHRCAVQIARLALPRHSIDMVDIGEYVAPINRIEQVIQAAWEEVLAVEPGSVGTQMSFFEVWLGPSSCLHIQSSGFQGS